jgi:hypothetical protein
LRLAERHSPADSLADTVLLAYPNLAPRRPIPILFEKLPDWSVGLSSR